MKSQPNSPRARRVTLSAAWLALLLCAACGGGDAARIDEFVNAVTGEVSRERIDQALAQYVDQQQQPVDVSVFGERRGYDPAQPERLPQDAHARLDFLHGKRLNVLRKHVEIKAPRAWVELQLLGREGMGNVRYELAKHADRWLIREVDIGR